VKYFDSDCCRVRALIAQAFLTVCRKSANVAVPDPIENSLGDDPRIGRGLSELLICILMVGTGDEGRKGFTNRGQRARDP